LLRQLPTAMILTQIGLLQKQKTRALR
jgi:hypothetical protein